MRGTRANTLAAAQAYANKTGTTVHIWAIHNGMHQELYHEWWPASAPETRMCFDRPPDYIIVPEQQDLVDLFGNGGPA